MKQVERTGGIFNTPKLWICPFGHKYVYSQSEWDEAESTYSQWAKDRDVRHDALLKRSIIATILWFLLWGVFIAALLGRDAYAEPPAIWSSDGEYLGDLSANRYDYNSTSNPYGPYGSRYAPNSINNPYGRYGSRYSPYSPNNPYAMGRDPGDELLQRNSVPSSYGYVPPRRVEPESDYYREAAKRYDAPIDIDMFIENPVIRSIK